MALNPLIEFLIILMISGLLAFTRYLKRKYPESHHTLGLIEWIALIMIPVVPAIALIRFWTVSLFWIYFPYVVASVLWIGISIRNAYHNPEGWSKNYLDNFIIYCLILVGLGVLLYLNISNASFDQLFP